MRLVRLAVENFRSIESLEWTVPAGLCALIGPGDSGKTAILDAIDLALCHQWNPPITDADFYDLDTSKPIKVQVTLVDLPQSFLVLDAFGTEMRGVSQESISDEPEDGSVEALTIQFFVDDSLEPRWSVVNGRNAEGKLISLKDRQKLKVARVGGYVDRHLAWGRGSALSRLSEGSGGTSALLATAARTARGAIRPEELPDYMRDAAVRASTAAKALGARPRGTFKPGMRPGTGFSVGIFELLDGEVPVASMGTGSRRLAAIGIQLAGTDDAGVILIDEIEHGLEPHRIRHVLRQLENPVALGDEGKGPGPGPTQVILTTHSPVVLRELKAEQINVVIPGVEGHPRIARASSALQSVLRSTPEAFIAHRVLLCEGKTEDGLCRAFCEAWREEGFGGIVQSGTVTAGSRDGGSTIPEYAKALLDLGLTVGVFMDSDRPDFEKKKAEVSALGGRVFAWEDKCNSERRVALDVPLAVLDEIIVLAEEFKPGEIVRSIAAALRVEEATTEKGAFCQEIISRGIEESSLREAVAKRVTEAKAFKDVENGKRLGELCWKNADKMASTPTILIFEEIRKWAGD